MKKSKFSKAVLKWSHVWSPREDCTLNEINILNEIFEDLYLKWDEDKKCFILSYLDISNNDLIRLSFLPPLIIKDTFECFNNKIESLEGGPIAALEYFCVGNKLKNLRGAPKTCGFFSCFNNPLEDFSVYTKPYDSYLAPDDADLIFIDPSLWTLEEFKKHEDVVKISDQYV